MKRNNKGFTLIELLAVIVILGLLMAIAIPSITKYITQSRRKTVVSSIDSYISSLVNAVNDQDYKFTTPNTIYAVPIECIALEKGGTNPFGKWLQANNDYWAYVLVQYDSENFSYTYGFTFKDSAGYGMYPISQDEINPKSKDQIKTGFDLKKPKSGLYTNIALKDNWSGFDIDDKTMVVVLESTEENADGKYTCPLSQKGDNYEQIKTKQVKTLEFNYSGKTVQIQYENGMTWGEWLDSEYNTTNFYYANVNDKITEDIDWLNKKWLMYNCPVISDLNATRFSNAFVGINEPIIEANPYWVVDSGTAPTVYRSLSDEDHFIYVNEDGMYVYVEI